MKPIDDVKLNLTVVIKTFLLDIYNFKVVSFPDTIIKFLKTNLEINCTHSASGEWFSFMKDYEEIFRINKKDAGGSKVVIDTISDYIDKYYLKTKIEILLNNK